jgi:hypothetical protein
VLTRATATLATLVMLLAFTLAIDKRTGGGSVVSGVGGAAPQTQPAVPALPTTAPPAGGGSEPPPAQPPAGGGS